MRLFIIFIIFIIIYYKDYSFIVSDGSNFALSDGSALLLRLHLEGVDVADRVKEQAEGWKDHNEDFVALFYDGHNCFTSLMAGDKVHKLFFLFASACDKEIAIYIVATRQDDFGRYSACFPLISRLKW